MMEVVARRELGTTTKFLVIEDGEQNLLFSMFSDYARSSF